MTDKLVRFVVKLEDGAQHPSVVVNGASVSLTNLQGKRTMTAGQKANAKFSFRGQPGSKGTLTIKRDGFNTLKVTDRIVPERSTGGWLGEFVV